MSPFRFGRNEKGLKKERMIKNSELLALWQENRPTLSTCIQTTGAKKFFSMGRVAIQNFSNFFYPRIGVAIRVENEQKNARSSRSNVGDTTLLNEEAFCLHPLKNAKGNLFKHIVSKSLLHIASLLAIVCIARLQCSIYKHMMCVFIQSIVCQEGGGLYNDLFLLLWDMSISYTIKIKRVETLSCYVHRKGSNIHENIICHAVTLLLSIKAGTKYLISNLCYECCRNKLHNDSFARLVVVLYYLKLFIGHYGAFAGKHKGIVL